MSLTGTTGKYQDNIEELKALPLTRYERIFRIYTEGNNGKQFYFYKLRYHWEKVMVENA